MLVLSRHTSEEVILEIPANLPAGTLISVMLVANKGEKVRMGFEAPRSVGIHRREIWEQIQKDRMDRKTSSDVPAHSVS